VLTLDLGDSSAEGSVFRRFAGSRRTGPTLAGKILQISCSNDRARPQAVAGRAKLIAENRTLVALASHFILASATPTQALILRR
jgi:hypothetical protein